MATNTSSRSLTSTVSTVTVVVLVVATALWFGLFRQTATTVTGIFDSSVGIYAGSDVRVLGVKVGTVTDVVPQGDRVEVTLEIDGDTPVPAQAQAAMIAPSVVADRYVQLVPAYSGGEQLADGAEIPRERTATPVELDELYSSLDEISVALGPNGANSEGALSGLLDTGAANLDGNGAALGTTITELGAAVEALNGSRGDLFGTVTNLQSFTTTLAENDEQVRQFNTQLETFNSFLADERNDLGQALQQLSLALDDVAGFVAENRESLDSNIAGLTSVTGTLVNQRAALAEILDTAPVAAGNLLNSYNPSSGTLDTRTNFTALSDPGALVCSLLDPRTLTSGNPVFEALGGVVQPLLDSCGALADALTGAGGIPSLDDLLAGVAGGTLPALPLGVLGASS